MFHKSSLQRDFECTVNRFVLFSFPFCRDDVSLPAHFIQILHYHYYQIWQRSNRMGALFFVKGLLFCVVRCHITTALLVFQGSRPPNPMADGMGVIIKALQERHCTTVTKQLSDTEVLFQWGLISMIVLIFAARGSTKKSNKWLEH